MRIQKLLSALLLFCAVLLSACGRSPAQPTENTPQPEVEPASAENTEIMQTEDEGEAEMKLLIGDTEVSVQWEANESVAAMRELAVDGPLTISMSMYGGFEQVGPIGRNLPRNDVQTVTEAGDIVLYAGNQIVVFYGSNSWAYTRLGKITDLTAQELTARLGNGNVVLTILCE